MMQQRGIAFEIHATADEAAQRVAESMLAHVHNTNAPVLGLATGGTPIPVYAKFVRHVAEQGLSVSLLRTFNLDEYIGLSPEHPQSYHHYMRQHLFDPLSLMADQTHVPDGDSTDPQAAAERYEQQIATSGGITLQLLGIGTNGHIGFNEPGSSIDSRTRVVDLASSTIAANARYFASSEDVPRQAISMGIGTIREAKAIILLATGKAKSDAVAGAILEPASSSNPASLLQKHPNVLFVLDREAASGLE